ncbi:MAG TPA: HAMP domain-containing sensor histidine kinase [Vicinamibacterales bacterium]|nr:HAMP domain-containing sensor histidine kinase [Vicinamibacterales bacterium]
MSDPVWYRSLYWRIAFGFVALLAVLLLVQALLFLWLTDRIVGPSSRTPAQLAAHVATDLSNALKSNPALEIETYLRERYGHIYQPFVVVMHDGRSASNRPGRMPPGFQRAAFIALRRAAGGADLPAAARGRPPAEIAPIVVDGTRVGAVAVPANPPPLFVALQELGPTLAWVAAGLLAIGAAVMALVIFRPAHRRLRTLEQAASALGQGRTDVRAAENGGDEVSSLARTFNRMADDLSARAAALSASDRARRQLLADVSHELMTPLAAIRGYTETLAMPEVDLDAATRQRYLEIVGEETQKLETMIGDLLDLARLEGGGGTLAVEDVRAADLFGRIADRHGPAIRERRLTLETRVDPSDLTVRGDPHRLEQALQNLAANALRHSPEGGHVYLSAVADGDDVRISVRDTGPGIPPEHLPRVFDRFYKVDASRTATAMPSGSGLGLSIVRTIVERHGGSVTADNAPGGGALFEIALPRGRGPVPSGGTGKTRRVEAMVER